MMKTGSNSRVAHYPPSNPRKMKLNRSAQQHENWQRSWAEIVCCLGCSCLQLFWPKIVMRKWLNISAKDSDYSADTEDDEDDDTTDTEFDTEEFCEWPTESRYKDDQGNDVKLDHNGALPRSRRRKSETFRAQYINAKEIKIRAGTWNVGGKLPPDHLEIEDWLNISDPADMYVIGFQEIIPLNAGNIFGAEDNRPVPKWENIIRETLEKIQSGKPKYKCYSDPPSPSRFKPSADAPDIENEILLETDSDGDGDGEEEIYPLNEEPNIDEVSDGPVEGLTWFRSSDASFPASDTSSGISLEQKLQRQFSSSKKLDRLNCFRTEDSEFNAEASVPLLNRRLARTISGTERMGLSWPEPPLDLLAQCVPERPDSVRSFKSFKSSKSFKTSNSFKSSINVDHRVQPELASLAEIDLESLINRKRRSQYVRIVSKQMVGLFLTIWVRRSLRRHIQNVNVSTVGVGVMGYIGNKGSISVSMSIFQTLFCFICTHLTSGEKEAEAIKRNADVHEIHRRTHFNSFSNIRLPKTIHDHERIIWLGDLNYRISLSYDTTRQLISKRDWSKLLECDQLIRELRKGRAFDGWSEGTLNFPPTYKYEVNSEKYYGEDPKVGRRTPAWCDRILSYGKGIKLMSYKRTELMMSDHRPVSATYMVEVEVFSSKKLQRALTFTDAEIEDCQVVSNI
ncbi:type IV inositol polyphosphate 5-phosphatase 3 isoform X2 [Daucus carota subsp. sativus]|uniref:type IV inositol polyphosphate 5-phosphatase 3 isoform X2 n=1 Tax=Daucus carota subsp. sativus TaxID=79200 RepID=UPI0007EF513C|nr:PREDICTED: type IV inositol polyphosphate 5-phosphatase 3-like isoform X3 [Daucus carota subsp. sativus]